MPAAWRLDRRDGAESRTCLGVTITLLSHWDPVEAFSLSANEGGTLKPALLQGMTPSTRWTVYFPHFIDFAGLATFMLHYRVLDVRGEREKKRMGSRRFELLTSAV